MVSSFSTRKGMSRILNGIIKYRQTLRPSLLEEFKKVATGPSPEGLLLTCVDSRVVASRITQAVPGQLFIVRNPGNLVPNHNCFRNNVTVGGECGALELACSINKVQVIVVIGHSDCKAMNLLYSIRNDLKSPSKGPLEDWLRFHGRGTLEQFKKLESSTDFNRKLIFAGAQHSEDDFEAYIDPYNQFKPSDKFSQINTLEQLKNFLTYPFLKERLNQNELEVHALWTDISEGEAKNNPSISKFKENPPINCYPEIESSYSNYSKESCLARNCLYDDKANSSIIQCYLSSNYGYILQNFIKQTNNILQLKLKQNQAINSSNSDKINSLQYEFNYSSDNSHDNILSFSIKRRIDKSILFDTSLGDLVLNNQFLQIITRLQSSYIYGFGENNHDTLKHNIQEKLSRGIFARDQPAIGQNENLYGTHPFYMSIERNGQAFGVFIFNSNAQDYKLDEFENDQSILTYRIIGAILDIDLSQTHKFIFS